MFISVVHQFKSLKWTTVGDYSLFEQWIHRHKIKRPIHVCVRKAQILRFDVWFFLLSLSFSLCPFSIDYDFGISSFQIVPTFFSLSLSSFAFLLASNAQRNLKRSSFSGSIFFFHSKSHTIFIVALSNISLFVCLFVCYFCCECAYIDLYAAFQITKKKVHWRERTKRNEKKNSKPNTPSSVDSKWILQSRPENEFFSNENRIFHFKSNE